VFQSELYELENLWSSHMTVLNSSTSKLKPLPDLLDRTRVLLGQAKNLVFSASSPAEIRDWMGFLERMLDSLYSTLSVTHVWRGVRYDNHGAAYHYAFEIARDLTGILKLLGCIGYGTVDNSHYRSNLSNLVSTYSAIDFHENSLLQMLRVELSLENDRWEDLPGLLLSLSGACLMIKRHDRAADIAAYVFWCSIGKSFKAAWVSLLMLFVTHRKPMSLLKVGLKIAIKAQQARGLRQLVGDSQFDPEGLFVATQALINLILA